MSLSPEVLDALLASGATAEMIVAAVKADMAKDDARREAKRANNVERQQRFRDKRSGRKVTPNNASNALRAVTPPNDIYSNPPVSPQSSNDDCPPAFEIRFVEAWNAQAGLKPARNLTGQRLSKLRRRVKEFDETAMLQAVRNLGASPFHCGKNDREWQADIGWLIRSEENVTKALELGPAEPKKPSPSDPVKWLEFCETRHRNARRLGIMADIDHWAEQEREARLKVAT